jgi:hypothetical protein
MEGTRRRLLSDVSIRSDVDPLFRQWLPICGKDRRWQNRCSDRKALVDRPNRRAAELYRDSNSTMAGRLLRRKRGYPQFVAMPLGSGYSAEEQITGRPEYGGLQIQVYPMRPEIYEKAVKPELLDYRYALHAEIISSPAMGLAPGGQMRQEIYHDNFGFDVWDRAHSSRCFVHLCNSLVWQSITGQRPPYPPPTAQAYSDAGLPWFDFYRDDVGVLGGSKSLAGLKSVSQMSASKGDQALRENNAPKLSSDQVIQLRKSIEKAAKVGPGDELEVAIDEAVLNAPEYFELPQLPLSERMAKLKHHAE